MIKKWKTKICIFMTLIMTSVAIVPPAGVMATDIVLESDEVSANDKFTEEEQKINSINMLNYIVSLTEEIQTCSGSKLYMEEIFNSLVNNTHPNAVDSLALDEVRSLLKSLADYRMIDANRERLSYILEQEKAQALRAAVPSPVTLLSIARTKNPLKTAASLSYMAIDAKTGYDAATNEAELKYMENNLDLDDKAYAILASSSSDLFAYMVNVVNSNGLNGDLSLTEDMVKDFVTWKNKDNATSKIQHFESAAKATAAYKYFGPFWLELADCYYEVNDYQKCLDAIDKYESLNIKIFRRDYEYAKILPKGISAAMEVLSNRAYVNKVEDYCNGIIDNSKPTDWASLYFVAETYMTLYADTNKEEYLKLAYDIIVENVNNLLEGQDKKNKAYLKEVKDLEKKVPKGASKSQKSEIEAYNKMLKSVRQTELVPISEPLLLNCELLSVLADKLDIDQNEKDRLDRIVHNNGNALFLNPIIDDLYRFNSDSSVISPDDIKVEFNGKAIAIPAMYMSEVAEITLSVDGENKPITDWSIKNVKRKKGKPVETFISLYESKDATKVKYEGGEKIEIDILPRNLNEIQPLKFKYEVKKSKRVGFLDNWNWLDKASEWSDDIRFERIIDK